MRIRKRQVPLPFSCISPVPLPSPSDPNFSRSPVVQLPQQHQPFLPDHPIGQQLPTQGRDSSALAASHGLDELKNKEDYLVLKRGGEGEERGGDQGEKSNYSRKKSTVLGAELGTGSLSNSQLGNSSHQALGSWGEGSEKAFPLKKRRGNENDDTIIMEKTKMNKKFVQQKQQQNDNEGSSNINSNNSGGAKKRSGRAGGAVLMEGSRCSRVNGRGWRCCQQTLVGYSLCEHHLGKGRLRSMTSVRSRTLANAAKKEENNKPNNADNPDHHQLLAKSGEIGKDDQEDDPLMMSKKRVKIGMVKARSISSLLGQNVNVIAAVADDHNN